MPSRQLRIAGVVIALSTPISGIVSYAVVATVVGEDRLEGPDGLTPLGWTVGAIPLLVGMALVAWSFTGRSAPDGRTVAIGLLGLGLTLTGLGAVGLATGAVGDANIGGGLLVIVGLMLAAIGGARLRTSPAADTV